MDAVCLTCRYSTPSARPVRDAAADGACDIPGCQLGHQLPEPTLCPRSAIHLQGRHPVSV